MPAPAFFLFFKGALLAGTAGSASIPGEHELAAGFLMTTGHPEGLGPALFST